MRVSSLLAGSAAVLLALSAVQASAQDMPRRKSGLWEIKTSHDGSPGHAIQQCVDAQSDELMARQAGGMGKVNCPKNEVKRSGSTVVVDSVCKFGNTTSTSHAVFDGDFDSGYKGNILTQFDPPMMGKTNSSSTIEARWTGPCKPGQKPGDVIMPGMGNININDMLKNMPKLGN